MRSDLLKLSVRDILKSVALFFITSILTGAYQLLQSGELTWEGVKTVLITAVLATISYLMKNFFTNNKDEFLAKDK